MMLFLFVLMLVGVDSSDSLVETIKGQRWFGAARSASASRVLVIVGDRATSRTRRAAGLEDVNAERQHHGGVAGLIFGQYVLGVRGRRARC